MPVLYFGTQCRKYLAGIAPPFGQLTPRARPVPKDKQCPGTVRARGRSGRGCSAVPQVLVALVDLVQPVPGGDELIELQPVVAVEVEHRSIPSHAPGRRSGAGSPPRPA